jgi:long-chain acyl-CoA synthetase
MKPHNLVEMLSRTVKRHPEKTALMWKENGTWKTLTYSRLWELIRDFAFGLERIGIRAGAKVAILGENHPRWLIADFATLSLGAVTVPIYPTLTSKQIAYILEDSDAEALIAGRPDLLDRAQEVPDRVRHFILLNGDPADEQKALRFDTVLQMGQTVGDAEWDWAWPAIQSSEPATIVYTSGTTDRPKGVMLSHHNLLSNIEAISQVSPVTSEDLLLSCLPVSHIFERTCGHFGVMNRGAAIAYAESPERLVENIREVRPTFLLLVPRVLEKMHAQIMSEIGRSSLRRFLFGLASRIAGKYHALASKGFNWPIPPLLRVGYALAHAIVFTRIHEKLGGRLRFLVSGGSSLAPEIARFFTEIGLPILEGYGMTECAPCIASNRLTDLRPGTAGKPLPGTEIRLLPDGELLVKSASVMMGYYNREKETANALSGGWLHTGDIAEIDDDGTIRIIDRKMHFIKLSNGKIVAPSPLETALERSPYISQTLLVGNGKNFVSALIVPDLEACREYLADKGRVVQDPAMLAESPEIRELISQEIKRLTEEFAPFERPKAFRLLGREFTVEQGELTPTLKVNRPVIEQRYVGLIDSLYPEENEPEMETAASLQD